MSGEVVEVEIIGLPGPQGPPGDPGPPGGLTQEAVEDIIGALLTEGTGIDLNYNDASGTLTISVSGLTTASFADFNESVQDQLGAKLAAGTGVTVTYDDGTGNTTVAIDTTGEAERIRDIIGTALLAGTDIDIDVDDTANTITINNTGSALNSEAVMDLIAGFVEAGAAIAITYDDTGNILTFDLDAADLDTNGELQPTTNVESLMGARSPDQLDLMAADFEFNNHRGKGLADPILPTDVAVNKFSNGWCLDSSAWTRVTDTTFTIGVDARFYLPVGTKVTWKESGTDKYGVVKSTSYSSPNTTVTLITNSSYSMSASPDSLSNKFSYGRPLGFPNSFAFDANHNGFSSQPADLQCFWAVDGGFCTLSVNCFGTGTSNATTYTVDLPIAAAASRTTIVVGYGVDNGTGTLISATVAGGGTVATLKKEPGSAAFTGSGNKGANFIVRYPI